MTTPEAQSETLSEMVLHVRITSEAPYASNITLDVLQELASTLDFTGMYRGGISVTTPSGEVLEEWEFGADWSDHDEEA